MENFIQQLTQKHFIADRQAFINYIRSSFPLNGDEITDIYNEVWIDVINNVRRGKTERVKNWKSYIFTLGWKRACKLVTRRDVMERIDDEDTYEGNFNKACLDELKDDANHMRLLEKIEIVRDVLERMPEKQRMIIVLYYLEGKQTAEVAELLGYSGSRSVITLKQRAMKMFSERCRAVVDEWNQEAA